MGQVNLRESTSALLRIPIGVIVLALGSCSSPKDVSIDVPFIEASDFGNERFAKEYTRLVSEIERTGGAENELAALADFYFANHRLLEARELYMSISEEFGPDAKRSYFLARILQDFGESEGAIAHYRESIRLDSSYALSYLKIGDALSKAGDRTAAVEAYGDCLERSDENAYALMGLGRIAVDDEDWEGAQSFLLRSLKSDSGILSTYTLLESVYKELGDIFQADRIREASSRSERFHEPEDPWLDALSDQCFEPYRLSVLGSMLLATGRVEKGIALLERAFEIAPEDASFSYQLGKAYSKNGDNEKAKRQFVRAIERDPGLEDAHYQLIAIVQGAGDISSAIDASSTALASNPTSAGLYRQRGVLLESVNRLNDAIAAYKMALELDSASVENVEALANCYWANGMQAKAIPLYEKACDLSPLALKPRAMLGNYYLSTDDIERASQRIDEAYELDPKLEGLSELKSTLHLRLGNRFFRERRFVKAETNYRASLAADSKNADVLSNLSMLYLQTERLDQAMFVARKLVSLRPDSAAYRTLAGIEMKSGDREAAIATLRKGLGLAKRTGAVDEIALFEEILKQIGAK